MAATDSNLEMNSQDLSRLFLPAWWVRAFDAAACSELARIDATTQALMAKLAPAMDMGELSALGHLVADFQKQLLSASQDQTRGRQVDVVPSEILKLSGAATAAGKHSFERVIQSLLGLRLVLRGDGAATVPFFQQESWTVPQSSDAGLIKMRLDLSEVGVPLIFGYTDAYADLLHMANGLDRTANSMFAEPPIVLSRAIWLELQGGDQALLLRLERAMQWDFRWLQLDGIYGAEIDGLFLGLKTVISKASGSTSEFVRRLKILAKLGRKLCDQGMLTGAVADQYLALGEGERSGPLLVWQASRERLDGPMAQAYQQRVGNFFLTRNILPHWPRFMDVLSGGKATPSFRIRAETFVRRSLDAPLGATKANVPIRCMGGELINLRLLFLEQGLRALGQHPLSVSSDLESSGITSQTMLEGDIEAAFDRFAASMDENASLFSNILNTPGGSLISPVTQAHPSFMDFMKSLRKPKGISEGGSPSLQLPGQMRPSGDERAQETLDRRPTGVSTMQSRMRKTASEELARIKATQPDHYRDLKKNYLGSLDEGARRLILDVQTRMQPQLFEEHLRQRLIRFMVENPSAWCSSPAN